MLPDSQDSYSKQKEQVTLFQRGLLDVRRRQQKFWSAAVLDNHRKRLNQLLRFDGAIILQTPEFFINFNDLILEILKTANNNLETYKQVFIANEEDEVVLTSIKIFQELLFSILSACVQYRNQELEGSQFSFFFNSLKFNFIAHINMLKTKLNRLFPENYPASEVTIDPTSMVTNSL